MLLLLCLLLLGKIESQVFLDALDGGVQVDLVAVVVKRSLMRYIINRGRADGRRAQLFDQGIPIAGQRVGGVGLLPVRDGLRQIGVFHIPLYREALVEGIQLHNGVCQHDLDKSFCQCGVGGVSRDGNDLFGLKAAAGQRPEIPEAKENIRVIGVFLGDQQTAAVVRGKISKKKLVEAAK